MKINGKPDATGLSGLTKPANQGKTAELGATGKAADQDQGSAVAKLSGKFNDIKAGEAPFDEAKVNQIKQAIKDGQFEVKPEAIADKVIASLKELTGQV
ncbi:MAG: flagellar biosynthesis anti-sigma factor FlgM [Limnobacter sp.]|nr:flagellar biosynthesis anti-sigma factor FlgM [Limnobacter sp.]